MIETALRSILTGYLPLADLVGTRIYPLVFPQEYQKPAIIYGLVSDPDEGSHVDLLIQYAVHAAKYTEAATVLEQIWQAFKTFGSGTPAGYRIHTIEKTDQIMQTADLTVPLYEHSRIFRVLYSEE